MWIRRQATAALRLRNMRITSTNRPLGLRILAASVGLGLACTLSACTIGETNNNDDDNVATAAATSTPATSAQQQSPTPGEEAADTSNPDTPDTPLDQLVLNAQDAPQLGLQPISAEDISGGMEALSGLTTEMRVDPPECADFNQDAVLDQTAPGVLAIQAGQADQTPISVGVTTDIDGIPERSTQIEDCPTMTITMPIQGTEVTAEASNTLLPYEAPEGVEQFTALSQETTMDMMGTEINSGNVMLTGTVRGVGVSVTATGAQGPVPESARTAALDAFTEQAAKIRNA